MEDEFLILVHDDGEIDDEEFFILYEANRHRDLHGGLPYYKHERFKLEELCDDECEVGFRFRKQDIYRLAVALNLPDIFRYPNGVLVEPMEACLKRYTYLCRYVDFVPRFGTPVPQLCMITNLIIDYLLDRYVDLLQNLNQAWLSPQSFEVYAIRNKGAVLDNCWGFIDGTVRSICRDKENQRMVDNGHKRVHALKFQSIATSNSFIAHLFGLVEGRRHDSAG